MCWSWMGCVEFEFPYEILVLVVECVGIVKHRGWHVWIVVLDVKNC